ncbi:MAG: flagellar filament outer layer protein FlaA [Spirochaetales bacterium]|nr:flagellar filament outer layer protein FlaA [Spirochaetales bacterium]
MKRGASLLISLAILLFFASTSVLIADERVQNLDSVVIENFDDPDSRMWHVLGSKFVTEGTPLIAYAPSWPEAVYGRNRDGLDLKVLGVQASFDRQGYNYLEFIPVIEGQDGELEADPISLPGRVQTIDMWVWGSNYDFYMEVHVRDFNGRVYVLPLGGTKFVGWRNLQANIPGIIPQAGGYITPGGFIKNIELLKIVLWTKPNENVAGFNLYLDQIKVLTDSFVTRFDGDDLADPEKVQEIWSNAGGR